MGGALVLINKWDGCVDVGRTCVFITVREHRQATTGIVIIVASLVLQLASLKYMHYVRRLDLRAFRYKNEIEPRLSRFTYRVLVSAYDSAYIDRCGARTKRPSSTH